MVDNKEQEINTAQREFLESFISSTGSVFETIQENGAIDFSTKVLYMRRALELDPEAFSLSLDKLYDTKNNNIELVCAFKLINDFYFNVKIRFEIEDCVRTKNILDHYFGSLGAVDQNAFQSAIKGMINDRVEELCENENGVDEKINNKESIEESIIANKGWRWRIKLELPANRSSQLNECQQLIQSLIDDENFPINEEQVLAYTPDFLVNLGLAVLGNPIKQFNLGVMYSNGQGVEQSYEQAFHWFQKAAEQDEVDAQYNLGVMYTTGYGVDQNAEQAFCWVRQAAEKGHVSAQYNLGLMYDNGYGVDQSYKQAFYWHKQAAEKGHANAQYCLGNKYGSGRGVNKNYEYAILWHQKAAAKGHVDAQYNLGSMYAYGQGVDQSYEQAFYWDQKAAAKGHINAQYNLGIMYESGQGVEQNYTQAVHWYLQAAAKGHVIAQHNLGVMYANGRGVERNEAEAIHWLIKAADHGKDYEDYQLILEIYDHGTCIDKFEKSGHNDVALEVKTYLGEKALKRVQAILKLFDEQVKLMEDNSHSSVGDSFFSIFSRTPAQIIARLKNELTSLVDEFSAMNEELKDMTLPNGKARRLMDWSSCIDLKQDHKPGGFVI